MYIHPKEALIGPSRTSEDVAKVGSDSGSGSAAMEVPIHLEDLSSCGSQVLCLSAICIHLDI